MLALRIHLFKKGLPHTDIVKNQNLLIYYKWLGTRENKKSEFPEAYLEKEIYLHKHVDLETSATVVTFSNKNFFPVN